MTSCSPERWQSTSTLPVLLPVSSLGGVKMRDSEARWHFGKHAPRLPFGWRATEPQRTPVMYLVRPQSSCYRDALKICVPHQEPRRHGQAALGTREGRRVGRMARALRSASVAPYQDTANTNVKSHAAREAVTTIRPRTHRELTSWPFPRDVGCRASDPSAEERSSAGMEMSAADSSKQQKVTLRCRCIRTLSRVKGIIPYTQEPLRWWLMPAMPFG